MARQRYTHRRSLRAGADPEAIVRYFRTYRRCHGDTLAEFVAHYAKLWDEANRYGVKAYEGIMRLVDLFPEEWRSWMVATAKLYTSSQPPTYESVGDMPGFLSAVSSGCFHFGDGPPPDTQAPESESKKYFRKWSA